MSFILRACADRTHTPSSKPADRQAWRMVTCPKCLGSGKLTDGVDIDPCAACSGKGQLPHNAAMLKPSPPVPPQPLEEFLKQHRNG